MKMSPCNIEVIKLIAKYLNVPVGTVCYTSDSVLSAVVDKQSVEGFASIVLRLASKSSSTQMSQEQLLLSYQWLEHIVLYASQAVANPAFARNFLEGFNRALKRNTYLTGNLFTVTDVAAYYALYPLMERLSISDKESLLHLSRWSKNVQSQPRVSGTRPPLPLHTLTLSVLAPAVH